MSISVVSSGFVRSVVSATWPRYVNYAFFGFAVAHEMNHAFDVQNWSLDENGNAVGPGWTNATMDKFLSKFACLVRQYGELSRSVTSRVEGLDAQVWTRLDKVLSNF